MPAPAKEGSLRGRPTIPDASAGPTGEPSALPEITSKLPPTPMAARRSVSPRCLSIHCSCLGPRGHKSEIGTGFPHQPGHLRPFIVLEYRGEYRPPVDRDEPKQSFPAASPATPVPLRKKTRHPSPAARFSRSIRSMPVTRSGTGSPATRQAQQYLPRPASLGQPCLQAPSAFHQIAPDTKTLDLML